MEFVFDRDIQARRLRPITTFVILCECRDAESELSSSNMRKRQRFLVFEAHDEDSHNHLRDCASPQLSWEQKQAARAQAKMNPLATVNEMR